MGKLNGNIIEEIDNVHHLRYMFFRLKTMAETGEKVTNKTEINLSATEKFTGKEIKEAKAYIEKLDNFGGWESFGEKWDVLWVGLDIRYAVWTPLRHNSPSRVLVHPIQIIQKIRGNPLVLAKQQHLINEIPIPAAILAEREKMFKDPAAMKQLEQDERVTEFLSGDVKAKIAKNAEKEMLEARLKDLKDED